MKKCKKKYGELCYLSELVVGEKAVVEHIEIGNLVFRQRLIEMGITKGVVVEIKKIAPLGDPVGIVLRNYELCVRKSELKKIKALVV